MFGVPIWVWFAVIALTFWGITGVTQKLSTNRISSALSFVWFSWAMIALSAAMILFHGFSRQVSERTVVLSIFGGLLNGLGTLTSFAALAAGGKASIVTGLVSLYPLLTVAAAITFLHEHPTHLQLIGIVTAIVAAVLLSIEPQSAAMSTNECLAAAKLPE